MIQYDDVELGLMAAISFMVEVEQRILIEVSRLATSPWSMLASAQIS
jgi:hypothetical protein